MDTIRVNFFGTFSISYGEQAISEADNRSKKLWKLLQYIVVNRTRRIPQEELVQLIWDENDSGENALSSLKTMLHRVRNTLDHLGVMDSRKIILQKSGTYYWNNNLDYTTDTDEFDDLMYKIADNPNATDWVLNCAMRALSLYKGYFLGGKYQDCPWAADPCKRYHEQFIKTFETAAAILVAQRRYDEVISLSERAIAIDNSQESFYYYLIRAYVEKGENVRAVKIYEKVVDKFYNELRQNPSDRLRSLYRLVSKVTNGVEIDIGTLTEKLSANDVTGGPAFVEYDTFCQMYRIFKQIGKKLGKPYYLMLFTVHTIGSTYNMPLAKHQERSVSMLREMISTHMKDSDVCTRYSVSQFLCAAYFDDEEQAKATAAALTHDFKYANLAVRLEITIKIATIE